MKDLYAVLGVDPDASEAEMRRAYRERARLMHPDRLGAVSDAEREAASVAMAELNDAWAVLGHSPTRYDYDISRLPGGTTGTWAAARPRGQRRRRWVAAFVAMVMLLGVASQFVGQPAPPRQSPADANPDGSVGDQVCDIIRAGISPADLAHRLWVSDTEGRSEPQYLDVVEGLVRDNCPSLSAE